MGAVDAAALAGAGRAAPASDRRDNRALGLLGAGHLAVDMSQGAIPAFLPIFATAYALTDVQSSMLLGAATLVSSAIQPAFGLLSDRRATPVFLWGGVAVAMLGLALSGLVAGYWAAVACILVSGLGVAAFHPEAARAANIVAGSQKASGVGWFSAAGNLGFALGPLLAAPAIALVGARGTVVMLVPGAVVTAVLARRRDRISPLPHRPVAGQGPRPRSERRGAALLVGVVTMRTWAQFGLLAIGGLYLNRERGYSGQQTALVIFAFTIAGAIGTVLGGFLAERIGHRRVLAWSMPLSAPALAGFVLTDGPVSIVLLFVGGLLLLSSFSVSVVLGQEYLPGRLALAAGLMIGFAAIGSAFLGLAWLSPLAEVAGRRTALWCCAGLPLVGGALAVLLPAPPAQTPIVR